MRIGPLELIDTKPTDDAHAWHSLIPLAGSPANLRASRDFIERHQAVHLLGPPGTGKSHLGIAFGVTVKAAHSVHFSTLADRDRIAYRAEREHALRERVRYLSRHRLLIVDEIGYLPVDSSGGNLFFQLVNACCERNAMILTTDRGFGEWGEIFGDAVVPPRCWIGCCTMQC